MYAVLSLTLASLALLSTLPLAVSSPMPAAPPALLSIAAVPLLSNPYILPCL